MIGPLLVGLPMQCFGVRVGFACCDAMALVALVLASSVWTRKLADA
jgi:hypothetical protein